MKHELYVSDEFIDRLNNDRLPYSSKENIVYGGKNKVTIETESTITESQTTLVNKFEDHYFKRVLGAYIHPELKGLFESNEAQKERINEIKETHRNSDEYKTGFHWFSIRQPEIEGYKWHYTQLKSSFIGEVAEQIKKYPTAIAYSCWMKEEHKKDNELHKSLIIDSLLSNDLISLDQYKKICEFNSIVYNEELI